MMTFKLPTFKGAVLAAAPLLIYSRLHSPLRWYLTHMGDRRYLAPLRNVPRRWVPPVAFISPLFSTFPGNPFHGCPTQFFSAEHCLLVYIKHSVCQGHGSFRPSLGQGILWSSRLFSLLLRFESVSTLNKQGELNKIAFSVFKLCRPCTSARGVCSCRSQHRRYSHRRS